MRQLQNDPEKKADFSNKNHRSNIPPDSAFTYGLIKYMYDHAKGGNDNLTGGNNNGGYVKNHL
jgi:hypothetical protein